MASPIEMPNPTVNTQLSVYNAGYSEGQERTFFHLSRFSLHLSVGRVCYAAKASQHLLCRFDWVGDPDCGSSARRTMWGTRQADSAGCDVDVRHHQPL